MTHRCTHEANKIMKKINILIWQNQFVIIRNDVKEIPEHVGIYCPECRDWVNLNGWTFS